MLLVVMLLIGVTTWGMSTDAVAAGNFYSQELISAKRALEDAHSRLDQATSDMGRAKAGLRTVHNEAARLRSLAGRRQRAATTAVANADSAEGAVRATREDAARDVTERDTHIAATTHDWRQRRGLWISLTAGLLALVGSIGLVALTARRNRDEAALAAAAARTAITLAVAVTSYLVLLEGVLWWADALSLSWAPAACATIGIIALAGGTAVGWRQPASLVPRSQSRLALIAALILIGAALIPASAVATATAPPQVAQLSSETLRSAVEATADAPMPAAVQHERQRAEWLSERAATAARRATRAEEDRDRIAAVAANARGRRDSAHRSVKYWRVRVKSTQASYDRYQKLTTPIRIPIPRYTAPRYTLPEAAPTTENFGHGNGSVGLCADGTLSDSIGQSGACSHHGGVR